MDGKALKDSKYELFQVVRHCLRLPIGGFVVEPSLEDTRVAVLRRILGNLDSDGSKEMIVQRIREKEEEAESYAEETPWA